MNYRLQKKKSYSVNKMKYSYLNLYIIQFTYYI